MRANIIKILLPLLFVTLTLPRTVFGENGFTWNFFSPDKGTKPTKALVMGKKLTYYPLEKGQEIIVTLKGPTRMRVLSRVEFGTEAKGEKSYYLRCEYDNGEKHKFRRVTTASHTAVLASNQSIRLGQSRSAYINVPAGEHTYRFYVGSKSNYRLYLRFYERVASVDPEADNVGFTPAYYSTEVPLIVNEDQVSYFRVGEQDSVRLSIIGPTTIKVLSRLEFDPTMITNQKFRIQVFEDGASKHIYPLRSEPSEVAEYLNVSTTLAGKGAKFFIEVPRGKHDYTFKVIDNGRNVLLRFYIPSKDLNNNL